MSAYSSQLSFRLRGKIDNDINTVPLSEVFNGNISASDCQTNKIVVENFDALIDTVEAGDYLFIKELKQVLRISGVTKQAGLTKKMIYVDGNFDALPTLDGDIYVCRIQTSGLNRPQALTITNDGAVDIILDNNPDAVIEPGENYSIWGGDKTIVPVCVDATGTLARFTDGENSVNGTGGAPVPPNPATTSGYELRPFYNTLGALVFKETKVSETGALTEQWYNITAGVLTAIAPPTNLAPDISVSKTMSTNKYGIAGVAGDFPAISGNIAAGADYVAFFNAGTANALVNGVTLTPDEFVDFPKIEGGTYKLIPYDGTGTTLKIQEIRF